MPKRISTSVMALLALQGAASAADLPAQKGPPAPAPLIYSWTGFYLGTHVGYGLNTVSEQGADLIPAYSGLGNPVGYSAKLFVARPPDRLPDGL